MSATSYAQELHDIRGETCVCGHFEDEHADTAERECAGLAGRHRCTCLGFRTRRSKR